MDTAESSLARGEGRTINQQSLAAQFPATLVTLMAHRLAPQVEFELEDI